MGADMPVEAPLWQFPMLLAHVSRDARTLSGGAMAARGRMLPSGVNASAIYRPWDIDLWRLVGSGSGDGYRENGCARARVLPVMRDETGTRVTGTLVC